MEKKLNAIGMFIFGGSASIGVENAGYKIDKVLEMTDDMKEIHAYHWVKNKPEVPIILPKEWENEEYLQSLTANNYDLLYSNCPCSSLSQINKNAKVDGKNNIHFYRVFNAIEVIKPKVFFIENAPTLVKLGYPILLDMVNKLGSEYKFTVIRDYGGNHGVPMKRMRTLVVGWRKDVFNNEIPLLYMNHENKVTVKDTIGDLYHIPVGSNDIKNHILPEETKQWDEISELFKYVDNNDSSLLAFIKKYDEMGHLIKDAKIKKEVELRKADLENGKRIWDKTPWKVAEDGHFPSMTSMSKNIHPTLNRTLTIREYARIMGYPDDFEFYVEECKLPIIQNLAQGVPAPFVKYITSEIKEALNGNRTMVSESNKKALCFQHHTHKKFKAFTNEELQDMKLLDSDKTFEKLEK